MADTVQTSYCSNFLFLGVRLLQNLDLLFHSKNEVVSFVFFMTFALGSIRVSTGSVGA